MHKEIHITGLPEKRQGRKNVSRLTNYYPCSDGQWRTLEDLAELWGLGSKQAAWKRIEKALSGSGFHSKTGDWGLLEGLGKRRKITSIKTGKYDNI